MGICISQIPLVQCSINSMPREMRKKTVSFVCLPEGRVAKLYAERIERGEISRNSSINLLPSRLRWINLSLVNLAKFKCNGSHQFGQIIHYTHLDDFIF